MKVLNLAEYVIRRATKQGKTITNLKLQKTLYYLQGYSLRYFSEPAFEGDLRSWQYGPVSPTVYFAYSSYGASPLKQDRTISLEKINGDQEKVFNKVIDACLKFAASELVQKTHEEDPWRHTEHLNEEISQEQIRKYFCAHDPLNLDSEVGV